jgi:hypothetical protein
MSFITTIFYVPAIFIMWIGSLMWEALTYLWLPLLMLYLCHHYRLHYKK